MFQRPCPRPVYHRPVSSVAKEKTIRCRRCADQSDPHADRPDWGYDLVVIGSHYYWVSNPGGEKEEVAA